MSSIKQLIEQKQFTTFEELKFFFSQSPYSFEIKEHGQLYMMCFTEDSDTALEAVREATGIIIEKYTNKVVHYSFKKCYDSLENNSIDFTTIDNQETVIELDSFKVSNLSKNYIVNLFFEGSLIKMYHYNGEWHIATSKSINEDNKWSSNKTFQDLFKESVKDSFGVDYLEFKTKLDPGYSYTFILQHPENNTIHSVSQKLIFILNKVNLDTLEEEIPDIYNFTVEKTIEELTNCEGPVNENFIIYNMDSEGKVVSRVKILNNKFRILSKLRGNFPDIGLRYLEVLGNTDITDALLEKFSSQSEKFKSIDFKFEKTCKDILRLYKETKIKHLDSHVPDEFKRTLFQMHAKYKNTKIPVNISDISLKLMSLNPRTLSTVIGYRY